MGTIDRHGLRAVRWLGGRSRGDRDHDRRARPCDPDPRRVRGARPSGRVRSPLATVCVRACAAVARWEPRHYNATQRSAIGVGHVWSVAMRDRGSDGGVVWRSALWRVTRRRWVRVGVGSAVSLVVDGRLRGGFVSGSRRASDRGASDAAQLVFASRCASEPTRGSATADVLRADGRGNAVVDGDYGPLAVLDNSRSKGERVAAG